MPGVSPPVGARLPSAGAAARRSAGRERRSSWCSPTRRRVPLVEEVTIGRAPGSTLRLADPTVSRTTRGSRPTSGSRTPAPATARSSTARGSPARRCATAPDPASATRSCRRAPARASRGGRTIVVRPGASLVVGGRRDAARSRRGSASPAAALGLGAQAARRRGGRAPLGAARPHPRRLPALSDDTTRAVRLLDGDARSSTWSARPSSASARRPARLARLLADLGERGFLEGVARRAAQPPERHWRRRSRRARRSFPGPGPLFERSTAAAAGCCSRARRCGLGAAASRVGVFVYLIARPLRDAVRRREQDRHRRARLPARALRCRGRARDAHGLTMASFGRRVERPG